MGVLTAWAERSLEVKEALNWWPPAGPLTGKAGAASGVFLTSWLGLHAAWRRHDVPYDPVVTVSSLLLAAGLIGSFPPFFQRAGERRRAAE